MSDNWDDREGYYCFRLGDVLNDRYEVFANQGRGVFSTVLRVRDTKAGNRELVVKLIRRNPVMYKAGLKGSILPISSSFSFQYIYNRQLTICAEVNLLKIVGANDPDNLRHCVRFYNCFEHRNHRCLVFEPMHMNLREVGDLYLRRGLLGFEYYEFRSSKSLVVSALCRSTWRPASSAFCSSRKTSASVWRSLRRRDTITRAHYPPLWRPSSLSQGNANAPLPVPVPELRARGGIVLFQTLHSLPVFQCTFDRCEPINDIAQNHLKKARTTGARIFH